VIRVKCPACGREWEYGIDLAGLTVVCKGCGGRAPVPATRPPAPAGAITAAPARAAVNENALPFPEWPHKA
jgi:hypothetical protein